MSLPHASEQFAITLVFVVILPDWTNWLLHGTISYFPGAVDNDVLPNTLSGERLLRLR
ncbi:hypothetical protein [Leptolyngbya sp. FACHB-261]|uniref:hypothetical protein n=1 Tax=Leptolyngbya sp. FACHB-261 TaxID=2692806 RepID=UPI001688E6DA|nr:hypothetical protein [Leptolyngbya sp. FACHB-261]MBD2100308.1 hypothetical protein [Leptolyngbya sp. FACHB-261]